MLRYYLMSSTSTESSIDPDTASGTLAAQDVILVPTMGAQNIELVRTAGSGTVSSCSYATDALTPFLVQKLIDGGITSTSNTEYADDGTGFTLATSKLAAVGGVAVATDGTTPGSLAEGDAAVVRTDRNRILLVNQAHPMSWDVSADYASAQTNASIKAADADTTLRHYLTDIIISNGATAGNITILDGSGGTVKLELYPAINGGMVASFRNPIKFTANTGIFITSTTVTTHSVTLCGYTAL